MCLKLKAILEGIRASKNDGRKMYGDFVFMGGSTSLLLPFPDVPFYEGQQGKEIEIFVSARPRSVVLFDRPTTLFELVSLLPRNSK